MEWLASLVLQLNSLTPLAIIGLLGVIIFLLVRSKQQVNHLKHNDLHNLPEMLAILQRIEVRLAEEFSWMRAKLNGK